jgi:CRP/FNR family cyclic AMP-dependent transcriptional regulator
MTSLGTIPAFAALSPEALDALMAASRPVSYPPGAMIPRDGAVLLLLSGVVAGAHANASGTEVWPARWVAPAIVDKPAALAPAAGTLVAATACRGRRLPAESFRRLLDDEPAVRHHVLARLAADAADLRQRLADAATLPALGRVAGWLLATGAGPGEVAWRGSQEGLARLLGLSRVTVNRTLRRLVHASAVAVTPRGVVLLDPARLASLSQPA